MDEQGGYYQSEGYRDIALEVFSILSGLCGDRNSSLVCNCSPNFRISEAGNFGLW